MKTSRASAAHRAAGVKRPRNPIEVARDNPRSKVKALRAYFWDLNLVLSNRGTPEGALLRRDADARYRAARARSRQIGLPAVIRELCSDCVGGHADPNLPVRVRDCPCKSCPLHPVRPWQRVKGRG